MFLCTYVLQSSFGKYLLVKTEDKDGAEVDQIPSKYGGKADDYHEDNIKHTHPPTRMKRIGDDYHDSNFTHRHFTNMVNGDGGMEWKDMIYYDARIESKNRDEEWPNIG